MHSLNTALFVAVAAAASQSSVTVLNPFDTASTLSVIGVDATATTYVNYCASSSSSKGSGSETLAGPATITDTFPTSRSIVAPAATITDAFSTAIPSALATATSNARRLRRQDDGEGDEEICESYTLIQGSTTWAYHLTDSAQGATTDAGCSWKGASTTADLTCIASLNGTAITVSGATTADTTTWKASDRTSTDYNTVAVIGSATSSGSGSTAKSTGSAAGSAAAGSAAASKSTGLAPAMALPTGAMAFVGGAAGLLAAAVAL